ncbi:MAG: extracellular solute-binding protein [Burkholderiales bacterium]|nr:extracellular solute-binding protein [Burkholderiales bacterium]
MKSSRSLSIRLMWFALLAICATPLAHAQLPAKNDAVYMHRGADRDQQLIEKAKQEGTLTLYTSLAPTESIPFTQAFEKKYGIKVELWRAVSDNVVQRAVTEARGKRFTVDVIGTNGPEMEMLAREKLLSTFHSPYIADIPPSAVPAHRLWIPDRMVFFVVGYNTNKVKREELPKTYEGFLDPKWKGRLGIEATDAEWLATIVKLWGQERGMAFFRKLSEMRPDVRKGHVLLAELIATGEVPVGLTTYNHNAESIKLRGGPIDWVPIEPVVARPQGIGVAKNAPHPHAALLYVDFVLSPEGQAMYSAMGRPPISVKVANHMNNFPYTTVDPATVLDEAEKWEKLWRELFISK